nr:integrase, catalytic region, zinc finger, CCHC-type, peptidase aspartic, catalytic [Tanacetum cinerariifolium]
MFDELLNPPPSVDRQAAQVIASIDEVIPQVQDDSTDSPSSTMVDQDVPSASKSHTTTEIHSTVIPQEVGISHETSVERSPQQNGVVERPNRTLIEAARTIDNLGKLQPKADIGIFIGYVQTKKAFRIYSRSSRRIVKTIHVDFDELTAMASEHRSSGPALHEMTPATISLGLVQKSSSSSPFVPPSKND